VIYTNALLLQGVPVLGRPSSTSSHVLQQPSSAQRHDGEPLGLEETPASSFDLGKVLLFLKIWEKKIRKSSPGKI